MFEVSVGDCRVLLRAMADASIDSVVTDPPYELGFMGKRWDASGVAYDPHVWRQVLRVLKPGGHLLAFGGTRTYHRMACAIEDAGFEVRDSIHWIYGSGFPKSLDVSKAINKASPATDAAREWAGWGTALKPAHEPIVVARKPLHGTVAANVLAHGTGAIDVDGCRVGHANASDLAASKAKNPGRSDTVSSDVYGAGRPQQRVNDAGRWPPNILLSHAPDCGDECADGCAVAEMDGQSGGASRFFPVFCYQAKASRADRDAGLDSFPRKLARSQMNAKNGQGDRFDGTGTPVRANVHPTVKPSELMRWLVRLVTPPGGLVLDPFTGSGSTGVAAVLEGFRFAGVELSAEYAEIARARIGFHASPEMR